MDADEVRELLVYQPETGEFFYREKGDPAGTIKRAGGLRYLYIRLRGKDWLAHRLAWAYMTGAWPAKATVDHKNGNCLDNKWKNLREANYSEQNANRRTRSDSKSGLKGVSLHWSGRWRARIRADGKRKSLGMYDTAEEAYLAYCAAARQKFGEFARISP